MVGWHVGGPDLGWGTPWLLEISSFWLLFGNFLGLGFLLDLDFGLTLLDLNGRVLVDLGGIGLSGSVLKILLGFRCVFLDLFGSLLDLSLLFVDFISLLWGELWYSLSLLLSLLNSLLLWKLLILSFLGSNSGGLGLLGNLSGLSGGIGSFNGSLGSSLSTLELSLSLISGLSLLGNFLISGNLSLDSGSLN